MFKKRLSDKSDEELMRLIAEGDSNALTELYNRYSAKLLRYFFRMLWKDEGKAQDFLHDLFIKIIRNPSYYTPGKSFPTWLYSVANNMCKNEYRKQALRQTVSNENRKDVLLVSIRPAAEDDEWREMVETALATLDEDEKNLYSLRFEAELSLEEIANMQDCPVGTVKSRLFYLKKKLAGQLQPDQREKMKYGL